MISRLKYRWTNFCDPLPGDVIFSYSPYPDEEPRLWKRRIRALITGYGPAWKLSTALWHWSRTLRLLVILGIIAYALLGVLHG